MDVSKAARKGVGSAGRLVVAWAAWKAEQWVWHLVEHLDVTKVVLKAACLADDSAAWTVGAKAVHWVEMLASCLVEMMADC